MLNQLKNYLGFVKDYEFANYLGIKPNSLSSWYSRNSFDAELIYSKCDFLNPGWLLTGEGDMILQSDINQSNVRDPDYSFMLEVLKIKDFEIRKLSEELGRLKEQLSEKAAKKITRIFFQHYPPFI